MCRGRVRRALRKGHLVAGRDSGRDSTVMPSGEMNPSIPNAIFHRIDARLCRISLSHSKGPARPDHVQKLSKQIPTHMGAWPHIPRIYGGRLTSRPFQKRQAAPPPVQAIDQTGGEIQFSSTSGLAGGS